jgi:uncharacterized protein DUF4167
MNVRSRDGRNQQVRPRHTGAFNRPQAPSRVQRNNPENVRRNYERYVTLAREARVRGDLVEIENCYQHAEHYFRVMNEREVR